MSRRPVAIPVVHDREDANTVFWWREQASCRGREARLFYPSTEDETRRAKAVCSTCPVRECCLEHALAKRERDGIWGGLTERERRRLQRQRQRRA